jgi:chromosomal replication initiation ATPase DnaA
VPITTHAILRAVAREFRLTEAMLTGRRRKKKFAHPRAIFVSLALELTTKVSQQRIGQVLGGRDHSTIHILNKSGIELQRRYPEETTRIRDALSNQL